MKRISYLSYSLAIILLLTVSTGFAGVLEVVSQKPDQTTANNADAYANNISNNGRYILFKSTDALDPNYPVLPYNNGLYIRDMETGIIKNVHVSSNGTPGSARPNQSMLSSTGQFVVFSSGSQNLIDPENMTWGHSHVYVHDIEAGITDAAPFSYDGSPREGFDSTPHGITPDGRFVLFNSKAGNLAPGDTNGTIDGFVWDRENNVIERITVGNSYYQFSEHARAISISDNGRYVYFSVGHFTHIQTSYVRDREKGTTTQINNPPSSPGIMTDNGRFIMFQSSQHLDSNYQSGGIFVYDIALNTTSLVSLANDGSPLPSSIFGFTDITNDGRFIVFNTTTPGIVPEDTNDWSDIFLIDRQLQTISMVSASDIGGTLLYNNYRPALSDDARYITYLTADGQLYGGGTKTIAVRLNTQHGCGI